jgi:effector-binding domain-containing protein
LEYRNIDDFLALLRKQKELTEHKIRELQQIRNRFQHRIEDLHEARGVRELGTVVMKDMNERKIVRLTETISSEPEMELSLRKLENVSNMHSSIFIGGVGLTIDVRLIQNEKFDEYNSIFILVEKDDIQNEFVTTLPQGKYACIYYQGNHTDSPAYYKVLLQYIKANGLQIIGDSIERTIIDHYISENKEDYLTELQIPVK